MSKKIKTPEEMIAEVMKRKEITRSAAIDYMLAVATGRLNALWRYDESVPEGKKNKGILTLAGRKQRAPKTPKIVLPDAAVEPKARAPKATKPKTPKRPKAPKAKAAPKPKAPKPAKGEKGEQIEIEPAAE